jgi:hypothetical protein
VLRLDEGAPISGRLVQPDGKPLFRDVTVRVGWVEAPGVAAGVLWAEADAEGRFRALIPSGAASATVAVSQKPYATGEVAWADHTVPDVAAGTLDLEIRMERAGVVEGRVVAKDGSLETAEQIEARSLSDDSVTEVPIRSGEFRFPSLRPGRYRLTITLLHPDYETPPPVEIEAPARGIRIEYEKKK